MAQAAWSAPQQPNGVITSSSLVLISAGDVESVVCGGLVSSCQVTNLLPFTTYNFSVRTCTAAGCSQSAATVITTAQDVPAGVPAPGVALLAARTVTLNWSAPATSNGIIVEYLVTVIPPQQPNPQPLFTLRPGLETSISLPVSPFSFYQAWLSACTIAGCSRSGFMSFFTLPDGEMRQSMNACMCMFSVLTHSLTQSVSHSLRHSVTHSHTHALSRSCNRQPPPPAPP
jgi:hypothetical protein